jgi:predicted transcriptional regulator
MRRLFSLGSKHTGKIKRWEYETSQKGTIEPRLNEYFKNSFSRVPSKNNHITPIDGSPITIDFNNSIVVDQCLKILSFLSIHSNILEDMNKSTRVIQPEAGFKMSKKKLQRRIEGLLNEKLLIRIPNKKNNAILMLTDEGKQFLKDPRQWFASKERETSLMIQRMTETLLKRLKEADEAEKRKAREAAVSELMNAKNMLNQPIIIPSDKDFEQLQSLVIEWETTIRKLKRERPRCRKFKGDYDNKFRTYHEEIDRAKVEYKENCKSIDKSMALFNYKNRIERYLKSIGNNEKAQLLAGLQNQVLVTVGHLRETGERLGQFLEGKSGRELREIINKFDSFKTDLEELAQPTHKWEPSRWTEIIMRPAGVAKAEGSLPPKPILKRKSPTYEKCIYCGKERSLKLAL